jgi:hypothetical protein
MALRLSSPLRSFFSDTDGDEELSIMAQPQIGYVLEEKLNEDADDDSEGGPEDPVAHLHRQAARIRRGEKLDRLTAKHKL